MITTEALLRQVGRIDGVLAACVVDPATGAVVGATEPVDADVPAVLPRRVPGELLPPMTAAPEGPPRISLSVRPPGLDVRAPDAQTLRRLLGSLQRMD